METLESIQTALQLHLKKTKRPLVAIVGPTASGKTGYSIALAKSLGNAEVINADSRQLYKDLSIGTAKITSAEMDGVPHHLLDVLTADEEAAAGWFQIEAKRCIDDILDRNQVPLLVGGSMLYVASITDGLTLGPTGGGELRQELEAKYAADKGVALHKKLQEVDPVQAAKIHQNNMPRLVRAIEIYELGQKSKTELVPTDELGSTEAICDYDVFIIGITREREQLNERINRRCALMFEQKWIEEVEDLMKAGFSAVDPGMKSHGYREIMHYLATNEPATPKLLQELIAAKTRQYARRQMTWWRNDARIHWLQIDQKS